MHQTRRWRLGSMSNASGAGSVILIVSCMTATAQFERPRFEEIVIAIRRMFPVAGGPEFGLTPESIDRYLTYGGIELLWHRIAGWEDYEYGRRDIPDEEFVSILFSPRRPSPNESIMAVTHECFYASERCGFLLRFGDLLPFARDVYPHLVSPPKDFFQPLDMVFVAEQSKLLVMLHHGGVRAQFAS